MKLIDGRPLWDFRARMTCDGDGGDDGGSSGSGDGMGGEGTGSGAVGPGAGGQGGVGGGGTGNNSDDVGSSTFGGNPDGTAIGTGMSAPGTAAASFAAPAPPPVAPPPPVAVAKAAPISKANTPAINLDNLNIAYANIPAMAPPPSVGFAGIGSPGFGGFSAAIGAPMNAMHNANPALQQGAPQSNVSFGTGPTAGMTGASSVGPASGFGTSDFGVSNTLAGGFSTVGPSMGMGFDDMFGGPIGFNDSVAGFEGVYGGTDEATDLNFGGMTPSFALDDALGIGSAGGVPGMTAAQANAVPTVAPAPSLVAPSGVTAFGAPIGTGLAPPSLATNLGTPNNPFTISAADVPAIGVQTTSFGPPMAAPAAPASAFGLSGPLGSMAESIAPMDMATALSPSTALNAAPAQEQSTFGSGIMGAIGSGASSLLSGAQDFFGINSSPAVGPGIPGIQAVTQAEIAPPPPLMEATPATQAAAAAAEAANLQLALENAPPGAAATPAVFGANGVAPASPSVAAPGAPASVLGEGGAGAFENAGLGLMGAAAAPAAVTATAPASAPSSATANVSPAAPAAPATPAAPAAPAAPVAAPAAPAAPVTAVPGGVAINLDAQQTTAQKAAGYAGQSLVGMIGSVIGAGIGGPAGGIAGGLLGSALGSQMGKGEPNQEPWGDDSPGDDGSSAGQPDRTEAATSTPSENVKRLEEKYLGLPMWDNPEITRNRPTPYQRFVENRSQYGRSL